MMKTTPCAAVLLLFAGLAGCATVGPGAPRGQDDSSNKQTFVFQRASPVKGIKVGDAPYSLQAGAGYEVVPGAAVSSPKLFSVAVPEGTYRVTVWLGGASPSNNTIKAESRQLVLHDVSTEAGQVVERSFLVNVRTPRINGKKRVDLKPEEAEIFRWDEKLTLEFNGTSPGVAAVRIEPAAAVKTVYLVGDSTVCDQPREPWASWGQMLPAMLDLNKVAVSNHAESGESYTRFLREKRWEKIRGSLRAGDVVIMQMGHNDQKEKGPGMGAFLNFKSSMERLIGETRASGATPVLVTPMNRRRFGEDGKVTNTSSDYPDAVRAAAKEQGVQLIELRDMSAVLYESFGKDGSAVLFVDNTHHNSYGAYLLARGVAQGLREAGGGLAEMVRGDVAGFDPAHPPKESDTRVPASPLRDATKPEGN